MPLLRKSKVKLVASEETKGVHLIIELSSIFCLGFLLFLVLFTHTGFLLGFTISTITLPIAITVYVAFLVGMFLKTQQLKIYGKKYLLSLCVFLFTVFLMGVLSLQYFAQTYDTSWDGQGYHANGVIALSSGWNPFYEKDLPVQFPDAAIFVQAYPKAVWIMQSLIYSSTGYFDSGKVTNAYVIVLAFACVFLFLRKLHVSSFLSIVLSLVFVLQPPYIIQIHSFQADLFSYEMTLIAISSLGLLALERNKKRYVFMFIMAVLLLAGSKFSNLLIAAVLGVIFLLIQLIGYKKLKLNINMLAYTFVTICSILLFLVSPYITNIIYHGHPFYPSNLKEVSLTYRQDNVPQSLQNAHNAELFFYGLFSKSQVKPMGNDDPMNIAELKIPFTFTNEELVQSATIFNNRVGSAGPLYSGIVVLTIVLIFYLFVGVQKQYRTQSLIAIVLTGVCVALTLLSPAANMLRYNIQIVFIIFIPIIAALLFLKKSFPARVLTYAAIVLLLVNALLFTAAVLNQRNEEKRVIINQLQGFKDSNKHHTVEAQNFYSNYIRLKEYSLDITVSGEIDCYPIFLEYTFYTTKVCPK